MTTTAPELLYLLHGDPADLAHAIVGMRVADVADALNRLRAKSPVAAAQVVAAFPFDLAVRVLDEPDLEHKGELLSHVVAIDRSACPRLIEAMSADERADLFRDLPEATRARLLDALTPETRRGLAMLLQYPSDTAGGIMTTEFVAVPPDWTVEQALRHVSRAAGAAETAYVVFVVDRAPAGRLEHVVTVHDLLVADRWRRVGDVGDRRAPITVEAHTDREAVARLIAKYNLLALPVVDDGGHLLGIVTVDDVIDAIVAENTEDVQRFGGVAVLEVPYARLGLLGMVRKRAGWLTALFLGEMLTATAMGHFEHEIARAVVLALFVPLIISSGGNSGSQATSLVIRAMALGELRRRDWWRVAARELPTGAALGAILGAVGATRILLWQALGWYDYGPHHLIVALTVALALVGVVTFGSLAGSMLPFALRRLGCDPASASAPFVATLVDVTGLVIYFSVAALVLRGTLL